MEIFVFRIDKDHAVQDDVPLPLSEHSLSVATTRGLAIQTELVNGPLAASFCAILVHCHHFQASFDVHLVVEEKEFQVLRAIETERSTGACLLSKP